MNLPVRLTAVLLLLHAAPSPAQQPADSRPTFKSGIDVVRLDVRITDAAGRPITDLRQEEIEVVEDGVSLPIVLFQRVTEPAESYVDAAIRAVTAEVSSNEAFPRGHLYILIFDQQHITPGNEQRARRAAEEFIRRRVRPSDRVALFAIPGPGPQIGFTADKLRAIRELEAIRGSGERVVSSPVGTMSVYEAHQVVQGDERLLTELVMRLNRDPAADISTGRADETVNTRAAAAAEDPQIVRRVLQENARTLVAQSDSATRQFLQRLADVIAGFRGIEGRKTAVLFSEGFFQDNLSRELETVAAAAAQSYCVFYTFDLNQRTNTLNDAYAADTTLANEIQARIAPLSTLAAETDGTMVVDAAGRGVQALDRLADQAQDYYLIGFIPSERARADRGKYRRLSVRVRRDGARASTRTGYALPPDATAPADRRRAIDSVLGAPFVQQGLRIDYTTYVMKSPEFGRQRVVLSLNADLPVRSTPADAADVVFIVRSVRDGRVAASGTDTIPLPASPRPGDPMGTGAWRVQFDVPAGAYLMRAVVREPGGLVGSADRRLDIRPLDGPDLAVSDLVLGSSVAGLPVRPRAYTGEGLSGVLETFGRTAVQLEGLDVTVQLRDAGGSSVTTLKADLQPAERQDDGVRRRASFLLPLEDVSPGNYLAHAIVRARGEIVAERTRQVEVLPGRAPAPSATDDPVLPLESVSPLDVTRGDLGRAYVGSLMRQADGTVISMAARRATEGKWEEAELELRRLASDTSMAAEALRGLALFVREDYKGAAAAFERAWTAGPRNALTAFFLGWAREGAGDGSGALSAWRSATHLDPALVSAHLALADGYLRISQPALAMQALRAGLTAIPSSPELQSRLRQIEGIHR